LTRMDRVARAVQAEGASLTPENAS
jgi:hypothetical protein